MTDSRTFCHAQECFVGERTTAVRLPTAYQVSHVYSSEKNRIFYPFSPCNYAHSKFFTASDYSFHAFPPGYMPLLTVTSVSCAEKATATNRIDTFLEAILFNTQTELQKAEFTWEVRIFLQRRSACPHYSELEDYQQPEMMGF